MPVYETKDRVKKGLPFGGIGAGKLEILPSGAFDAFTFQNNWSEPLTGQGKTVGLLGYHLGVSVTPADRTDAPEKTVLLQTERILNIPTVQNIRYEGVFPRATLFYDTPNLGVRVTLEVFSSWIPGDVRNSSLPAVFFKLRVRNLKNIPVKVGLIFMGRNTSGAWCVGRRNRIHENRKSVQLEFSNHDPASFDPRRGALRFSFERQGWDLSFIESWNAVSKNFSFTAEDIRLVAWEEFTRNGRLPNTRPGFTTPGENRELCGAVAAAGRLAPKKEKELCFTAGWFFPHHAAFGHRYQKYFRNAGEVTRKTGTLRDRIEKKITRLHELAFSLPFPRWFNDALLTSLAPFFASSWHAKDGRFAFYEAPKVCPLMGTLDVGFYGSIPLSYFFPELEFSQLWQFARAQRPDGYVPHDLGRNRLDLASDGTTFYRWKDLNPKFILMAARDHAWSGRKDQFLKLYPHIKKAVRWTLKTDRDGDGLPDHEGADQTFDLWDLHGPDPYTSGLWLAALLAARRAARLFNDREFFEECSAHYRRARKSFEETLWTGRFFGKTCSLSQLNGQWYAGLLGLGPIADKRKIRKALKHALTLNRKHSRYGLVNSALPSGRLDTSNNHAKNIWVGMNWAFLSLCVLEGFPLNEVLNRARDVWDNIANVQKSPWDQPDMIDAKTGRYLFGDFYYRNMAIWSSPIAYAMKDRRTAAILQKMRALGISKA